MVLHDMGMLHFDEPFRKFRAHGLIVKDGAKMSKSRGNVVVLDEYITKRGADTFRTYLMFLGPFQDDFRDDGNAGPRHLKSRRHRYQPATRSLHRGVAQGRALQNTCIVGSEPSP